MHEKKPYSPPQLYEVVLDQEQAILATCSLATMATSAGGNVGCRPPAGCRMYPGVNAAGCKRSVLPAVYMGSLCHDSGPRAS
ncbi:MAG: hypothetical protein HZC50_12035 [Nitrospirae bacterium]|nr:hypothetical protein [Nitrospirota bacterium]